MRRFTLICIFMVLLFTGVTAAQDNLDQSATQWLPVEWSIEAPSVSGNPFDVIATVTFVHGGNNETRVTGMFYDGGDTWKFRFTGTQAGTWTFSTSSSVPELNGLSGTVNVTGSTQYKGFVAGNGKQWIRTATGEAFSPQFIMAGGPHYYAADMSRLNADITEFMDGHGFNGLHVPVFCRWMNLANDACSNENVNPDLDTFRTLDTIIAEVYSRGGVVHLWAWGDNSRNQNPSQFWGLNGVEDQRLQRYIAARLGPMPGWTMGYGFDLFEWVTPENLETWHSYMQEQMGWTHFLGARGDKNSLDQFTEQLDYSSYEQQLPTYDLLLQAINMRQNKPSFSEDRFRIGPLVAPARRWETQDIPPGLWWSTMVGGIAGIWGNLPEAFHDDINMGNRSSDPFPNKTQIQTHFTFFEDRFLTDMNTCNDITDGYCLGNGNNLILYKEDTTSIQMDLSVMVSQLPAVAVDTNAAYAEIDLGTLAAENQTWTAPYSSNWAIAIGTFDGSDVEPTPEPTDEPTQEPTDPAPEVQLQAPLGIINDSNGHPTYIWNNVADAYELYLAPTNNLTNTRFYGTLQASEHCSGETCSVDLTTLNPTAWLWNDAFTVYINSTPGILSGWQGPFEFSLNEPQPNAVTPGETDFTNPVRPVVNFSLEGTGANSAFYYVYLASTASITNPIINGWFTREQVCGGWQGTNCSVTADLDLPAGFEFAAYIQSWGPGGFSTGGNIGGLADGWTEIKFTVDG